MRPALNTRSSYTGSSSGTPGTNVSGGVTGSTGTMTSSPSVGGRARSTTVGSASASASPSRARAPSYIALPAAQPASSIFSSGSGSRSSRPSTPQTAGVPGAFGPGSSHGSAATGNGSSGGGVVGSPSSPRSSFLPSFMQRNRPRAATLTRSPYSSNQVVTQGSIAGTANGPGSGTGTRNARSGSIQSSGSRPGSSGANVAAQAQTTTTHGRASPAAGSPSGSHPSLIRSVSTPAPGPMIGSGPNVLSQVQTITPDNMASSSASNANANAEPVPTFRIRLVPHLESYRSVHFEPVVRDLKVSVGPELDNGSGTILKVGRFTEKAQQQQLASALAAASSSLSQAAAQAQHNAGPSANAAGTGSGSGTANQTITASNTTETVMGSSSGQPESSALAPAPILDRPPAGAGGGGNVHSNKVAFKSKVVSRAHAEIWVEDDGKFYLRDTKSSSGTFLNHIRLSNPNQESRPYPIKDGDVIQLGVDYQGGAEEMYRCIKMKVEIGRRAKKEQTNYNMEAMKQLRALGGVSELPAASTSVGGKEKAKKVGVCDCCICLFAVTVSQALFIAPCSHTFHYKCIRPMLQLHHPGFACPLCRSFHNLEADVELDDWEVASRRQSSISRAESVSGLAMSPSDDQPLPPVLTGPTGQHSTLTSEPNEDHGAAVVAVGDVTSAVENVSVQDPSLSGAGYQQDDPPSIETGAVTPREIPRLSAPSPAEDSRLDATTPMNNTFLSTLAETMSFAPVHPPIAEVEPGSTSTSPTTRKGVHRDDGDRTPSPNGSGSRSRNMDASADEQPASRGDRDRDGDEDDLDMDGIGGDEAGATSTSRPNGIHDELYT